MRTTARSLTELTSHPRDGGLLVHQRAEPGQHRGIGLRHDAVTEVEDVARAASGLAEYVLGRLLDALPRAEEHRGVEVALHAAVRPDLVPAAREADPPVEADHVAADGGHVPQQRGGARPEVNGRAVDGREDPGRVRGDEL